MPKNRILVADDNKLNQDLLSAILGNDYDYLYVICKQWNRSNFSS